MPQVDLFFYREPEETRPAEEEGGLAAIEFGGNATDFSSAPPLAGVPALADPNWNEGAAAGGDWEPAAAPVAAGGGGGDWTATPGMRQVSSCEWEGEIWRIRFGGYRRVCDDN